MEVAKAPGWVCGRRLDRFRQPAHIQFRGQQIGVLRFMFRRAQQLYRKSTSGMGD